MKRAIAAAAALIATLGTSIPAHAADPQARPGAVQMAAQLTGDETAIAQTRQAADALEALPQPAGLLPQIRLKLAIDRGEFAYRQSVRAEEVILFGIAGDSAYEAAVLARMPAKFAASADNATRALRALWRLSGIDDITAMRPHMTRRQDGGGLSAPELVQIYQSSAAPYGIDWTYLAAINFIESDFGRVVGPSSAGALGPMQFMPGTWGEYGTGDVMNAHDAVPAAARYLAANGAPGDMADAIFHYNLDWDYVEAVSRYAHVIQTDPEWLSRFFYWGTFG